MIIDDSSLQELGTIWRVDLTPTCKHSVRMDSGLFLNKVCICDSQELKEARTNRYRQGCHDQKLVDRTTNKDKWE